MDYFLLGLLLIITLLLLYYVGVSLILMVPLGLSAILIVKPGIGADTLNTMVLYTKLNSNLPYTLIRVGYTKYETEINKVIECMKVQQPVNNAESVQGIRTLMDTLITDKNCYTNYPKSQSKNTDAELLAKFNHLLESKKLNDSLNTKISNTINLLTCVYNMSSTSNSSSTENAPNVSRFIRYVFEYILDCKNLHESNSKDENILNEFVSNMVTKIGENFPELKDSSDNEFYRFALSTVHIDFVEITQIMYNQLYLYYLSNNSSITNLNTTIHQAAARLDRYQKSILDKISELSQGYDKSNVKANWVRAYHKYMEGVIRTKLIVIGIAKKIQYTLYNLTDNIDEQISEVIDGLRGMFNNADIHKQVKKLENLLTDAYTKSRAEIKLGGGPQFTPSIIKEFEGIEKDVNEIKKLAKLLEGHDDIEISTLHRNLIELIDYENNRNMFSSYDLDNIHDICSLSINFFDNLENIYTEFLSDDSIESIKEGRECSEYINKNKASPNLLNKLKDCIEICYDDINNIYQGAIGKLLSRVTDMSNIDREKILKNIEGLRAESLFDPNDESNQIKLLDSIAESLPADKKNLARELNNTYLRMKEKYVLALGKKFKKSNDIPQLVTAFTDQINHNQSINVIYDNLLDKMGDINKALALSLNVIKKIMDKPGSSENIRYNTILMGIYDKIIDYLQNGADINFDDIEKLADSVNKDNYGPIIEDVEKKHKGLIDQFNLLNNQNKRLQDRFNKIKDENEKLKNSQTTKDQLANAQAAATRKQKILLNHITRVSARNKQLINDHRKALSTINDQLQTANAKINTLNAEIFQLKADHATALNNKNQPEIDRLNAKHDNEIAQLKTLFDIKTQKSLTKHRKDVENIRKGLDIRYNGLKDKMDIELADIVKKKDIEIDTIKKKIIDKHKLQLQLQINEKDELVEELSSIKNRLRELFAPVYVDAIINPAINIVDAKVQLSVAYAIKNIDIRNKNKEIERLTKENTKASRDKERAETSKNRIIEDIKNMKSKGNLTDDQKKDFSTLNQRLIDQQKIIDETDNKIKGFDEKIKQLDQLQKTNTNLTTDVQDLNDKNTALTTDVQNLNSKNSQLESDIQSNKAIIDSLNNELNRIKATGMYSDEDVKELIKLYTALPHNLLYHENVRRVMQMYMHKHPL